MLLVNAINKKSCRVAFELERRIGQMEPELFPAINCRKPHKFQLKTFVCSCGYSGKIKKGETSEAFMQSRVLF
jgi:hypothetical protein